MADLFQFELVSPEKLLLSAEVEEVVVPGSDGDMTVLARHAPFMTTLRPGVVSAKGPSQNERIFVRGGFAEVGPQGLTILAEQAISMADLDRSMLDIEIKNAEEDVADATDDVVRSRAAEKLASLRDIAAAL